MSLDSLMKMKELELESDQPEEQSEDDCDVCDEEEISRLFKSTQLICQQEIALDKKYILHVTASNETSPNVASSISDFTCEVHSLSNSQLVKLETLSGHSDVLSEAKFCHDNSNLLYTCSNDGTIKLWDLRSPTSPKLQFEDTTSQDKTLMKAFNCFDVSPNNRLLAAGTNLCDADAFILFWDLRKASLLGGYWESHTYDITQVKFHPDDSNKLISGSVDGLVNLYDLAQTSEDDALIDSLNTESSIEKLNWLKIGGKDVISCITHTADVQFWTVEDAQPFLHLHRSDIAETIRRKSESNVYVVNVHQDLNSAFLLVGLNCRDGQCLRGISVVDKSVNPMVGFPQNEQIVRGSWYNYRNNLLLTGGEKGILNAWRVPTKNHELSGIKKRK